MDDMDTGDDDSESSSDSKAIIYGTIFGALGLWLLCVVDVSTKGSRKFGYDHKYRYNSSNASNNNDDNEPAEGDDPNEPSRTTTTSATTSTISCCRFSKYGANQ
jgi:hypothetical protein